MRIANLSNRLVLIDQRGLSVDVAAASEGLFDADPQEIYERWEEFRGWVDSTSLPAGVPFSTIDLQAPAPCPRQVFAIGLNYRAHAAESNMEAPGLPAVFTKFQSSIAGAHTQVEVPAGGQVDWEVEMVVVIGVEARNVAISDAWSHVAGITLGQDLSERVRQLDGGIPQFSLGKSFPGFSPMGPNLVSIDEFENPDDLQLSCELDGVEMQNDRTSNLIHSVPDLVEHLSGILRLLPGDVIFTGTPSGVGFARDPKLAISPGSTLISRLEGVGEIRQTFR